MAVSLLSAAILIGYRANTAAPADLAPFRMSASPLWSPTFATSSKGRVFGFSGQRGSEAVLYSTSSARTKWEQEPSVNGRQVQQMRGGPDDELLADDGDRLHLSHSADGGAHWETNSLPPGQIVDHPFLASGREAWVMNLVGVGFGRPRPPYSGAVFHTVDGGRTWTIQGSFDPTQFHANPEDFFGATGIGGSVAFRDPRHGIFTTSIHRNQTPAPVTDLRLFITEDGGSRWLPVTVPGPGGAWHQPPLQASVVPGGFVLVAPGLVDGWPDFGHGFSYYSTDNGQHWSGPRALPPGGLDWDASQHRLIAPEADQWRWASDTDIYASSDQGQHWSRLGGIDSHLGIHNLGFSTANRGWLLASVQWYKGDGGDWLGNTLFTTEDGGRTWSAVPPPNPAHFRVPCQAPSHLTVHYQVSLSLVDVKGNRTDDVASGVGRTDHCDYWINTDGSGTIHIDLPSDHRDTLVTIADYGALCGCLPSFVEDVTVNGHLYHGDFLTIPLRPNAKIVVR